MPRGDLAPRSGAAACGPRAAGQTPGNRQSRDELTLDAQPGEPETGAGLVAAVEGLERRVIREALARANGTQTRAAELLGISERVLRYKLKKYGLSGPG